MSDKTRQCSDLSPEIKINDCITWMPDAGVEITCESSREGERLPACLVSRRLLLYDATRENTQPMTLKQQTIHDLHHFGLQHLLSFLLDVIGVWDLLLRGFEAYFLCGY